MAKVKLWLAIIVSLNTVGLYTDLVELMDRSFVKSN